MTTQRLPDGFCGTATTAGDAQSRVQRFSFRAPCTVRLDLSTGRRGFVQIHHCIPLDPKAPRMRLLSRMLWQGTPKVPGMNVLTKYFSNRILQQDLLLLAGQHRRLQQGAPAWGCPVAADRIALEYRRFMGEVMAAEAALVPEELAFAAPQTDSSPSVTLT
jgi:hypothetical protein